MTGPYALGTVDFFQELFTSLVTGIFHEPEQFRNGRRSQIILFHAQHRTVSVTAATKTTINTRAQLMNLPIRPISFL